ncbi:MAG: hypothetical protein J6L74_06120, partial [Pseudomonas sp.]|nr:hypothetical protein [Pseudomonas sp.]
LLSGVVGKRAEHVVMECARVHLAVDALKKGNIVELNCVLFGRGKQVRKRCAICVRIRWYRARSGSEPAREGITPD